MLTFWMTSAKCWYNNFLYMYILHTLYISMFMQVFKAVLFVCVCVCVCVSKVSEFTDKVNFYVMSAVSFFKSMWPKIKSSAALFVGKSRNYWHVQIGMLEFCSLWFTTGTTPVCSVMMLTGCMLPRPSPKLVWYQKKNTFVRISDCGHMVDMNSCEMWDAKYS